MEIVLYSGLTSIWWAASVTVLLPFVLLLFNDVIRSRSFAFLFARCVKLTVEPNLVPLRQKTFELLKESLSERDTTKPLDFLEIGIGAGENFQFYPKNSHLITLDVNVHFNPYLKENKRKYSHIVYERTIIAGAENMKDVDDSSMDVVVSTYCLCSVTSTDDALKEVRRVLKPGGKFLFLEHVSYPKSHWGYFVQKFTSPLWTLYGNGCCLQKNTASAINKSGFSDVICEKIFPKNVILYIRPHIYGIATK